MKDLVSVISDLVCEAKIININEIKFTVDVRKACERNMCGLYNTRWTCPPAVGSLEECKGRCEKYNKALVFTTFDYIEDSFDFEGMLDVRAKHDSIQQKVMDRLKDKLNGYLLLGAGGCTRCKKCNYPNPCRFPSLVVPSVESYGIDVVTLSSDIGVKYNNGDNTVTYFSILFFNE